MAIRINKRKLNNISFTDLLSLEKHYIDEEEMERDSYKRELDKLKNGEFNHPHNIVYPHYLSNSYEHILQEIREEIYERCSDIFEIDEPSHKEFEDYFLFGWMFKIWNKLNGNKQQNDKFVKECLSAFKNRYDFL